MLIKGTYTLQASPEQVWQRLMDQQSLLRTVPGIEQIEQIAEHSYEVALSIKAAPLQGTYSGRLVLSDLHPLSHYHFTVEGAEHLQSLNATADVYLSGQVQTTAITYQGMLTLGKDGALLPTTLVKGAAQLFIQQFFNTLADQLRPTDIDTEEIIQILQPGGNSIFLSETSAASTEETPGRTFFTAFAHLLRLGEGDPAQEIRWGKRLQRISTLSGLILLIWVGTRIPGNKERNTQ